jgi:hypothetical protein
MGEDQAAAVHLLRICIQLKLEQLVVCICMDEQPEVFVKDNNFVALAACLLDHNRSRGNLLQFRLHRLHGVGPKRQILPLCTSHNILCIYTRMFIT